jgi:tetratricopeptide (TPR) repeat protein
VSLTKAQAYFERAIKADSAYALAYAGLSDAYGHQSVFGFAPPVVGFPRATEYAARALALDSTLVQAHTSLGFIALFYEWDLPVARRELAKALRLDSLYGPAHLFHAWYFMAADSVSAAIDEGRRAVELDPFSSINNTRLVTFLFYGRRYSEALDQARTIIERDSTFIGARLELAWVYVSLGRCADALAELARAPDRQLRGVRGYVYAKCGRRAQALSELDALRRQADKGKYVSHYWLAVIHGGLGNKDQALRELEQAYAERAWTMFMLRLEPAFDGLHGDPRFERLVRRVGLAS